MGRTSFLVFATNQESRPKREWRFPQRSRPLFHLNQAQISDEPGKLLRKVVPGTVTAYAPNTQYQPYWILKVSEYRIHPRTLMGRRERPIMARRKLDYRGSVRGKCTDTSDPSAIKAESAGSLSELANSWPYTLLPALSK
jgi:hypothetical protein